VVAVGRVDAELFAVIDHVEDDRPQLLELIDVVAPRLRDALGLGRVGGALRPLHPHHLGLDPAEERIAELLLDLVHDPFQVLARVGFEELTGLRVVAIAEDARHARIPRKLTEGVTVGDGGELGFLRTESDVAVAAVDEEIGSRPVDELIAILGHLLPLGRGDALAVHVAGNRDLLEEDVLDPFLVDLLADRLDLLAAAGIVPGLLERRDRVRDRPLCEDVLHLREAGLDSGHVGLL
jgi:hypothetical protein